MIEKDVMAYMEDYENKKKKGDNVPLFEQETTTISDEEMQRLMGERASGNLFKTGIKWRARYGQYSLSSGSQVSELEDIQDKCLAGEGLLVKEEWHHDVKNGDTIISVKYLVPRSGKGALPPRQSDPKAPHLESSGDPEQFDEDEKRYMKGADTGNDDET